MVEKIIHGDVLLAIIVYKSFSEPGIHFFTPDHLSQQLAFMKHPAGKEIVPHVHNRVPREIQYTQEVLIIKSGKLRVDFYDEEKNYFVSRLIGEGDTLLLTAGGHGFEVLEEVEMIEVKQGPHAGELDKTHIEAVDKCLLKIPGRYIDS